MDTFWATVEKLGFFLLQCLVTLVVSQGERQRTIHESLERERVKKFPEEICRLDRGGGREKNFWFFSILMFAQTTNM